MSENLALALQITLVGMSLVFLAILFLWGLMVLVVRLTRDGDAAQPDTPAPDNADDLLRRQAAAVAVAVALARQNEARTFPLPPTALVSAWQAVRRAEQLTRKGPRK